MSSATALQKAKCSIVSKNNVDPVCRLRETVGKIAWGTKVLAGVHNKCSFVASTVINGDAFAAEGKTLENAKKLCALMALKQVSENSNRNLLKNNVPAVQKSCTTKSNKFLALKTITNLPKISKIICAKKKPHNLNTLGNKSKSKRFLNKSVASAPNTSSKKDNEVVLLPGNEKQPDMRLVPLIKNNLPLAIEEIDEDCIIVDHKPTCSNFNSKSDSMLIDKTIINEKTCLSDLDFMLNKKLNAFKSVMNYSHITESNEKTIELKLSLKRYAKNPIANGDLLDNEGKNQVRNLKRSREEDIEQSEVPLAKRPATERNKELSKIGNPVKHLKKLHPNLRFDLEAEVGSIQEPFFMVSAMLENRKFFGHGKNRYLAENDVAIQILDFIGNNKINFLSYIEPLNSAPSNHSFQQVALYREPNNQVYSSLELPSQYADIVEAKIMNAFDDVMRGHEEFNQYKVLAGIIMTFNLDFKNSNVVSIATGTKCINGGNICCNGSVLNDSHAEILAKRGLMKFLFTQLRGHCSINTTENSVFEKTRMGYRLKPYVHFHLYINTAPCGDARVHNFNQQSRLNNSIQNLFNNLQYGQLRTKMEGAMGTRTIGSRFYPQTWDGVVLGEPLHTMSCSDKIALWNVVGIQGALLSQFVEPIYLHSITLGSLFDAQHMYRAMSGRIEGTLAHLPPPYHLNRPLLGQTSKPLRRSTNRAPIFGINWTSGDNDIEIISLSTGRTIYNQTSFLTKQAFFFKYVFLCNNLPNICYSFVSNIYAEAKQNAKCYQCAKREALEAFQRANLGNWVKKPREQNEFKMNF